MWGMKSEWGIAALRGQATPYNCFSISWAEPCAGREPEWRSCQIRWSGASVKKAGSSGCAVLLLQYSCTSGGAGRQELPEEKLWAGRSGQRPPSCVGECRAVSWWSPLWWCASIPSSLLGYFVCLALQPDSSSFKTVCVCGIDVFYQFLCALFPESWHLWIYGTAWTVPLPSPSFKLGGYSNWCNRAYVFNLRDFWGVGEERICVCVCVLIWSQFKPQGKISIDYNTV